MRKVSDYVKTAEAARTLADHADTTMIVKVYGHLLKDTNFMREAARRAIAR